MCTGFAVQSGNKQPWFCFHPGYQLSSSGCCEGGQLDSAAVDGVHTRRWKWYDWTLVFRRSGVHSWEIQDADQGVVESDGDGGGSGGQQGSGGGGGSQQGGQLTETVEAPPLLPYVVHLLSRMDTWC